MMLIFIENVEIYPIDVTCWQGVFTLVLWLFKSFCLCFYDVALWNNFTAGALEKFRSAYVKCIKVFFRYTKSYSVTAVLTESNLCINLTVSLINVKVIFNVRFTYVATSLYNILCVCI